MTGDYAAGIMTVSWNVNHEKLFSPDGTKHLLICDVCKQPIWVSLPVVAVMCETCANADPETAAERLGL